MGLGGIGFIVAILMRVQLRRRANIGEIPSRIFRLKLSHILVLSLSLLVVCLGALRTSQVVHALLDRQMQIGDAVLVGNEVSGQLSWVEKQKRGSVAFLRVAVNDESYSLLRLYGRDIYATSLKIGCFYRLKIKPIEISGEQVLGGYNARRAAFFSNEIGRGFIDRVVEQTCDEVAAPQVGYWGPHMSGPGVYLAKLRYDIAARYRNAMSETNKIDSSDYVPAIAIALVTGMRQSIPETIRQDFRASGLAHVLAISGLHMALFAGSVFAFLRFIFALFPGFAQRFDIRKICAVLALLAATGYFLISGASYATQRAYIMITCMFLAILIGRPAISLNNVAASAIIILWLRPDALFQPGFQMSFAAVLALVRSYELWARYKFGANKSQVIKRRSAIGALGHWGGAFIVGLLATSFIAGSITSLVGMAHFGTMAKYGLLANLLAMPVFVFLVMPLAFISLIVMPTPLFHPFVQLLFHSIKWVAGIAHWVTGLPNPQIFVAQFHPSYLVILFAGLLWFCWGDFTKKYDPIETQVVPPDGGNIGLRKAVFHLGVLALLILTLAVSARAGLRPDIYILGRGNEIAIRDRAGNLKLLTSGQNKFVVKKWFIAEGIEPDISPDYSLSADGATGASSFCKRVYCRIESLDGRRIDIAYSYRAREVGCEDADLVISYLQKPRKCAAEYFKIPNISRDDVIAGFYHSDQPFFWRFVQLNDHDQGAWQTVKRPDRSSR
jgi:competence protein ComEC